ncbi:MobC family replication-relaxation protein [Paraperlucidibaca sp.]|uniref:MobC family replication-relaxation protein n=1 Tax=Paraperlucidibaca sp. TaxID=2708021 RepID=UPI0030F41AA3
MLIKSYDERIARQTSRHNLVLRFLRDEIWSSSQVLTELLGGTPALTSKTMSQLERLGHVLRHQPQPLRQLLWGITPHGLAHAWNDEERMQIRAYFEPSKLSPLAIPHHLDIQHARLRAQRAGWSDWIPESILPRGLAKRPDAVVVAPDGRKIAIEVERHVKTVKRYEAIFSAYLQAIRRKEYDEIHYIVPDRKLAVRLQRVFGLITAVPVIGDRVQLNEKHRARFRVSSREEWPI